MYPTYYVYDILYTKSLRARQLGEVGDPKFARGITIYQEQDNLFSILRRSIQATNQLALLVLPLWDFETLGTPSEARSGYGATSSLSPSVFTRYPSSLLTPMY